MRILAIDPGTEKSGWLVWCTEENRPIEFDITENANLVPELHRISGEVDFAAIEFPQNYGMSIGASTLHTCRWVGLFEAACACPVKLYGRPTIKGQIGGRTDAEIRASLRMRYGESRKGERLEGIKTHLWACLALAVALEENPNLKEAK